MTRVGLLLALPPEAGGAYHYSHTMLEAVSALPRDRYAPVAVYLDKSWPTLLAQYDIHSHGIRAPLASTAAAYAWRKSGLPIGPWRTIAPLVEPLTRRLLSLENDLWIYPGQDPMAYMLPVPALTTVHDLMHRYEGRFPEVAGYRMRELHYRATCRYARGILVDSEIGKNQLVASYGVAAVRVHALPYIPASYMYARDEPSDVAGRFDLPGKFFFYPAQFWSHKNHVRLLRAADALSNELPDIQFVFAGARKNGYAEVVSLARELKLGDRVRILDYMPNAYMPALYRRARALIMPTFFGPTNIPPLEAMVAGCPVAVSGIYGMPEQCGDAALYFDPASVEEIAGCMARLWTDDDLCARLSARGRIRAAGFTQETFNRNLLSIVDGVSATL
jgi:glycosyltransferase involved in cell wall biosynthesis